MCFTLTRHAVSLLVLVFGSGSASGDAPVIRWGEPEQGIQVGMAVIEGFGRNGGLAIYARPATNYAKNLVAPMINQALDLVLRDSSNNVVKPRPGGAKFGVQLQTKMSRNSKVSRQLRFPDAEGRPLGGVNIDDCFPVKETGDYELEIKVRLLKEAGGKLVPVLFAPIRMKLHLVANTPEPLPLKK